MKIQDRILFCIFNIQDTILKIVFCTTLSFCYDVAAPCGPGTTPFSLYLFASPLSHLLLHLLVLFAYSFSPSYSLYLFSCFSIRFHSTRILSLLAGCRRRRLNLFLVFCVDFMLCVFLVKDACPFCRIWFSFVLRCDSCLSLL